MAKPLDAAAGIAWRALTQMVHAIDDDESPDGHALRIALIALAYAGDQGRGDEGTWWKRDAATAASLRRAWFALISHREDAERYRSYKAVARDVDLARTSAPADHATQVRLVRERLAGRGKPWQSLSAKAVGVALLSKAGPPYVVARLLAQRAGERRSAKDIYVTDVREAFRPPRPLRPAKQKRRRRTQ